MGRIGQPWDQSYLAAALKLVSTRPATLHIELNIGRLTPFAGTAGRRIRSFTSCALALITNKACSAEALATLLRH